MSTTTQDLELIARSAKDFAESYLRPHVIDWDEAEHFPIDVMQKMGEYGFLGVLVPEQYGGSALGYQEYITIIEEIAKVDSSIGLSVAAHNSLCTNHILMFGNEAQKQKYLPKLATGEWIGAWGLTEAGTGSDAGRMQCVARREGDYYILNGTKTWITHGHSGQVAVIIVRTGELLDSHGMSAFIIDKGVAGYSSQKITRKLGMRSSETAELMFDNCKIHKDQLLGKEGDGFIQAMKILDGGRISIAALALGIAKGAYEASLSYAQSREQFGKPIATFQGISFKLADMATKINAAELLTRHAADIKNNHGDVIKASAIAKYYASEICVEIATDAVQIHGGNGYTKEYPVEKFFRDSKLCTIGEGTSEIQKLVISREILKGK